MRPGDTIGGYIVEALLGAGSLGAVYAARHALLDRKVAIQVPDLDAGPLDAGMLRERFLRMAKLLAELDHPHIVRLHDFGEHDGRPYAVLEFVEGRSLGEIARGGEALDLVVLLRAMISIASALHRCHERGVIHNAVTPWNILVAESGEPVLADFSLAGPIEGDPLLPEDRVFGPLASMAPESFEPQPGPRADIWSLGATIFTLLSGVHPIETTGSAEDVIRRIRSPEPVDLSPLVAAAPEYVVDLVGRCLRKDPEDRYPTADALKRALEAALEVADAEEGETRELMLPRAGQTVLLHVEYQEADRHGAFRPFEIAGRIGGGAFGEVFRAVESLTGRAVALKILRREHLADPEAVARFRREATLLSRLRHPGIVEVLNFGRYGDTFFIEMELLGERTLADVLAGREALAPREAAALLGPILDGLAAVHDAGMVHRDLKPQNIAVERERVVLFDFGLARSSDLMTLTRSGVFLGSPIYAAPEQATTDAVTGATDVYAAGVILYEMLSAARPHEGDTPLEILTRKIREPPAPIAREDLPDEWRNMLAAMLAPDPSDRPSAAESREWLSRVVG
jgi:serine/threonine protein kinase